MAVALQRNGLSAETGAMETTVEKMETSLRNQEMKLADTTLQIEGADKLLADTGGSSESMVASVTAEIKLQKDKIEVLSPTVVPMQTEIAASTTSSNSLQAEIAVMKAQVSSNATDKSAKDDTIANTANDIMILKDKIAQKKAEIDPLPEQIDDCVAETERLEGLISDYQAKHGGMRSADFTAVKNTTSPGGFTSVNQNGTKPKTKAIKK
mmetsp:Transcript_87016/g.174085  ORF Transcript_87016/g.174085 Transcript_87016/m.174085 type:complete len:210 (-) Transcript_87016:207-836(-)